MYFVLRKAGLEPPRTAAAQLRWLKSNQRLHEVPRDAVDVEHPSFKKLRPGDLLFWGTPGSAEDGAEVNVTHVAMYLGAERRDGHPVMINSTDGRSYRGTKANGYGVYDFRLPRAGAKVAFIGYGTPPGIAEMPDAQRAALLHVSTDENMNRALHEACRTGVQGAMDSVALSMTACCSPGANRTLSMCVQRRKTANCRRFQRCVQRG
jgi:hypothetical protein